MYSTALRQRAITLRAKGLSYSLIQNKLGVKIPKSTFSYWCRNVQLPASYWERLEAGNIKHLALARLLSRKMQAKKRKAYLDTFFEKNLPLGTYLQNEDVAKIILTILYLGEGSKTLGRGSVVFGNSDPATIKLFLKLLRGCYSVDESKFRCTVQYRADQDTKALNTFWSKTTLIPLKQFYAPRIDARSRGKKTTKKDYKGVCRVDYFKAEVLIDLLSSIKVLTQGL